MPDKKATIHETIIIFSLKNGWALVYTHAGLWFKNSSSQSLYLQILFLFLKILWLNKYYFKNSRVQNQIHRTLYPPSLYLREPQSLLQISAETKCIFQSKSQERLALVLDSRALQQIRFIATQIDILQGYFPSSSFHLKNLWVDPFAPHAFMLSHITFCCQPIVSRQSKILYCQSSQC